MRKRPIGLLMSYKHWGQTGALYSENWKSEGVYTLCRSVSGVPIYTSPFFHSSPFLCGMVNNTLNNIHYVPVFLEVPRPWFCVCLLTRMALTYQMEPNDDHN